ncbi:MAG: Rrf2 family transcriptional regulator [Kiritimatiellota bacterium]|nr:Rrf2 family transcriptional regulator [Kiritimatiellota bacterium]
MSTKGHYGLRFMIDLATNSIHGKVTLHQVAKRQAISEKYLWQIANRLKAVGLIRATAGPHGGYALAKPPSTITLRDILTVLEGDCTLVACVTTPTVCPRSNACASREVWKEVDEKLAEAMESITLSAMVAKERAMAENSMPAYSI